MTDFARTYGGSLYELARDEGLTGEILSQLQLCDGILAGTPEYTRFLSTPAVTREARRAAVDESFGPQVHPYVAGFLKLLVDRGQVREFSACVRAFRERYNEDNGILEVTVTTVAALTDSVRERLLEKLTAMFDRRIVLEEKVDPGVLGGMRLECAGKRYDGTVRDRLDRIRRGLRETVL